MISLVLTIRRFKSTIFALSSGYGKCGVAVVRVSGPKALTALEGMTKLKRVPDPRTAQLCTIIDPVSRSVLDHGLVFWFPGPKSFTGENSVEFHLHGGIAVINSVLDGLGHLPDFRPAERGEFTKRAFRADKIDLTQVEGLSDLINAETEMQQRLAISQMRGDLRNVYSGWRNDLVKSMANLEALIDFSESEEIEDGVLESVYDGVESLLGDIQAQLQNAKAGERLRSGVHLAIVGDPNVGKSSLLNALSKRPVAIVSPTAGTTRDLIEISFDLRGFPVVLVDTAGLREDPADHVEVEGVKRARANAESADVVLYILDASMVARDVLDNQVKLQGYIQRKVQSYDIQSDHQAKTIVILNKSDLLPDDIVAKNWHVANFLSCKTNYGFDNLVDIIECEVSEMCQSVSSEDSISLTRTRHVIHAKMTAKYLQMFLEDRKNPDLAISCEYLRKAMSEIGNLSGKVNSEQILDVIFADFCIGK